MDINAIRKIINQDLPDHIIKSEIINHLATDEDAIPTIMLILKRERKLKNEIQSDLNLLLSKADIGLDNKKFNQNGFIQSEIKDFFDKYKNVKGIGHCFKKYI